MKQYSLLVLIVVACLCSYGQTKLDAIDNLLMAADYKNAIQLIDYNLAQKPDNDTRVLLDNRKVDALIHQGKFDTATVAINHTETFISKTTNPLFYGAILYANKGFLYLNQGRNDGALDQLQKSMSLFDQAGKTNTLEIAQALSYLGQIYIATGKYNQAEEQLQMALAIRQHLLLDNNELIAASYNDLGLVYSFEGNNDKASEYYEKALALYEKIHGKDHPKIAITNTNIGVIYRNLEFYGDAINDFDAALKIWEKVYPQPHPSKAFVLSNLAQTYSKMGDNKNALLFYDRSLKMYQDSYGTNHPDIARVLNTMGNIRLSSDQYDNALVNYQNALKANVTDFESDATISNPTAKNFYNGNVLLYSLLLKAQALEARYYGKTLKFSDLKLALKCLHTCDTLIDKLRQQITNESDKIALGTVANEVYGDGVRIAYSAGMNAFKKSPYFEDAFYFAEKSKSAVLLEAISDTEAKSFAGIPESLLEDEQNLKSAIALCNQKLAQKPSSEEEKYLRETSFALNRSYELFTKKLEQEYPEYFNLKYNAASPSIRQVQNLLDHKTTMLSYFNDDKKGRLYIFEITQRNFKIIDHAFPKTYDKYVTGIRNSLFFSDLNVFTTASQNLFSLLIPKLPGSTKDLVILPTGRLGIIPFETLLTKAVDTKKADYKTLPYLLNQYSVRYEFSAGLLLQKSKEKQNANALSIFLCAPVSFPEKDNLDELPGTAAEVKAIAHLFASTNHKQALYIHEDADEKLVKSGVLKDFGLLHFATHGVVDERNPELSRVFLQSNSNTEDGNLFAGEIYNLQLNANLVTLSACQTGLGKISKGEGVIGLSRALVYAGAKNVMVSFWSVADESTAKLMEDFYKLMLANPTASYSSDLRNAKLKLMQSNYAAPYYWAPFILIGF